MIQEEILNQITSFLKSVYKSDRMFDFMELTMSCGDYETQLIIVGVNDKSIQETIVNFLHDYYKQIIIVYELWRVEETIKAAEKLKEFFYNMQV